jgi:hypothetical protein
MKPRPQPGTNKAGGPYSRAARRLFPFPTDQNPVTFDSLMLIAFSGRP